MFSGIVESFAPLIRSERGNQVTFFSLKRPAHFDDLRTGDSIAVNGVCLTLESFDEETMQFALGPETLKITGWGQFVESSHSSPSLPSFNLERSLRFGDRIHGHLLSGHVDAMGQVTSLSPLGEALEMVVVAPEEMSPLLWKKGSVGINGVSLTVNQVSYSNNQVVFSVCLIPETLRRTNLGGLQAGDPVTLEADSMARALWHWQQLSRQD